MLDACCESLFCVSTEARKRKPNNWFRHAGRLNVKGRLASFSEQGARVAMDSTLDIYTSFFKLTDRPFALLPDPDFIYWSAAHQQAYSMLEYGLVTRAPITLITGEVGAGKTTLVQHLLRTAGEELSVALLSNANSARGELLQWVFSSFDQKVDRNLSYVELFDQFQKFLIAEYAAGRRVVLIIDEAQTLDRAALEELRMLTNINNGKDELIQLVLVGQPELRDLVRQPDMTQFAQRVSAAFHLPAMDAAGVRAYIAHRLIKAGGDPDIFTRAAMDRVFLETRGIPRLINQLCDLAMVYAYSKESANVTGQIIQAVLQDGVFFGGTSTGAPALPQLRAVSPKKAE